MLANSELTNEIIGAAISVHKELGPGFLESIYEEALAAEFNFLGIPYERQKAVQIYYRDRLIGDHRLDFLVAGSVKATRLDAGLLFNFAAMPLTIKRVGREEVARPELSSDS